MIDHHAEILARKAALLVDHVVIIPRLAESAQALDRGG
jgi:hypothetical protein